MGRKIKTIGLCLFLSGSAFFGVSSLKHYFDGKSQKENYGTRENPKYQAIIKNNPKLPLKDFASDLRPKIELANKNLEGKLKTLESFSSQIETLDSKIKSAKDDKELKDLGLEVTKTSFNYNLFILKLRTDDVKKQQDLLLKLNNFIDFSKESFSIGEKKYGPLGAFSLDLIKKITGKQYPSDIKIYLTDKIGGDEGTAATYSFLKKEIIVERSAYLNMVSRIAHETGHAFSQQSEEEFYKGLNVLRNIFDYSDEVVMARNQARLLDEASAYAFSKLLPFVVEDKDVSERLLIWENETTNFTLMGSIKNYKNIQDIFKLNNIEIIQFFEMDENNHGFAQLMADATVTYFQDPVKAYNYLSTVEYKKLKPEIWAIMEQNISVCEKNYVLKKELEDKIINNSIKFANLKLDYLAFLKSDNSTKLKLLQELFPKY